MPSVKREQGPDVAAPGNADRVAGPQPGGSAPGAVSALHRLHRQVGNRAVTQLVRAGCVAGPPARPVQRRDATAPAGGQNLPPDVARQLLLVNTTLRRVEPLTPENQVAMGNALRGAPLYDRLLERDRKRGELSARRDDLIRVTPIAGVPLAGSPEARRIAELNTDIQRLTAEVGALERQVQGGLRDAGVLHRCRADPVGDGGPAPPVRRAGQADRVGRAGPEPRDGRARDAALRRRARPGRRPGSAAQRRGRPAGPAAADPAAGGPAADGAQRRRDAARRCPRARADGLVGPRADRPAAPHRRPTPRAGHQAAVLPGAVPDPAAGAGLRGPGVGRRHAAGGAHRRAGAGRTAGHRGDAGQHSGRAPEDLEPQRHRRPDGAGPRDRRQPDAHALGPGAHRPRAQ